MNIARTRAATIAAAAAITLTACETGMLEVEAPPMVDIPTMSSNIVETTVCEVIDFEQFTENGALVTSVASGFGFDLGVSVAVDPARQSLPEARIFDVNANTVTNDPDLRDDAVGGDCPDCGPLGNVLIIQQKPGFPTLHGDMIPDDSRSGGTITFDGFAGHGDFFLESFIAVDDDANEPKFEAFADGMALVPTSQALGDGTVELVTIETDHVFNTELAVDFGGSGAIDDLVICQNVERERGEEGCTPGYWKQEQHFDSYPAGYLPTTLFGDVFTACSAATLEARNPASGDICEMTLLEALSLSGGGQNALARHAAAGFLNAASGDVEYQFSTSEVVDMVNDAIESGAYEDVKDTLEFWNEETPCPLN